MAYDTLLELRIKDVLSSLNCPYLEKKMFGGLAFMINGKMAFGIVKEDLMVRVIPEKYESVLQQAHVREMDFTGKPMKGFIYVAAEGMLTNAELETYVKLGIEFVS